MSRAPFFLLMTAILATLAGGLGGSFQPSRVILVMILPIVLLRPAIIRSLTPGAVRALWFVASIVVGGTLSLAWTKDLVGGIGLILATIVGSLGFFAATRESADTRSAILLLRVWVLAVALSIPAAVYEIVSGNHFEGGFQDRIIGSIGSFPFAAIFFGNYNDYSTWLVLAFPFAMAALTLERSRFLRLIIAGLSAAVIAILVVNTSRGALIVAVMAFVIFSIKFKEARFWFIPLLPILAYFIITRFNEDALNILELVRYRLENTNLADESISHRTSLLTAGLNAIVESYGFGIGAGGFEEYINDNYPSLIPNAHNILLEIAVNFGFIPLVAFISFLANLFRATLKNKNIPDPIRASILYSILALPIVGAVPSHAVGYVYWWVWLATLVVLANCGEVLSPSLQGRSSGGARWTKRPGGI